MIRWFLLFFALLGGLLLASCTLPASPKISHPQPDGSSLVLHLHQQEYYAWPYWPGKERFYQGMHAHGLLLSTRVSKGAEQAILNRSGSIPDGGIIVKENYTPSHRLVSISVMYKRKGFAPGEGDWFWLKYNPDGSIAREGVLEECLGCHRKAQSNDYLFTSMIR